MRRLLLLSTVFLLFAIIRLYLGTDFKTIPDAFATGGAFPSTKHGGGTVDGIDFSGIDRSIGGEVTSYFGDEGTYEPGECAHCHEVHSSFGGTEPPPTGSVAQPYLLFKATDNNFCWYCHEMMSLGIPPNFPGYGYWGFYQGQLNYTNSSHGVSNNVLWPGRGANTPADPATIWPRRQRTSGDEKKCINCHTPHGIQDPNANGGYDYGTPAGGTNYGVGTDPDIGEKGIIPRQLIAREEALCLMCHDGTPATNIKSQVDFWGFIGGWAGATQGSGHPVRAATITYPYFNRHNFSGIDKNASTTGNNEPPAYTAAGGWFTSTTRHSECTDCHNPHIAQGKGSNMAFPFYGNVFQRSRNSAETAYDSWNTNRYDSPTDSTSSPIKIGPVNKGVWGVVISDLNTGNITGIDTNLDPTFNDRLFQLCLKCHSYWAWGVAQGSTTGTWYSPTTTMTTWDSGDGTNAYTTRLNQPMSDQSWEFALNRVSYHPVFGAGKNRPELGVNGVFEGGAGDDTRNPCWCSGTTCPPDTLSYPTQGRYGNGLCTDNGGNGVATGTRQDLAGTTMAATLSQAFVPPWLHTSRITCVDCHEDSTSNASTTPRGPHGSARPFILRGIDTSISFPICTNSTCTATSPVNYSAIIDPNNFCINCHRADVYGYNGVATTYKFSRVDHINLDNGNPGRIFVTSASKDMPNGIICMLCHGAAKNQLGLIHGNDRTTTTNCVGACTNSARLLAINSGSAAGDGEWRSYTKAYVGTAGACSKGSASAYCGHTGDGGWSTITALYNY